MSDDKPRNGTRPTRRAALIALAAVGAAACTPAASSPIAAPKAQATTPPTTAPAASPATQKPARDSAAKPATSPAPMKPAAATAPAKLNPVQKIKLGIPAVRSDHAYRYMGVEKGFYRDLGVDVEFVQLRGDPLVLKALLAQEVDLAEINIVGVLGAIESGGDLKVLGSYLPRLDLVLYSKKSLNKMEDLYGKSVAHSGDNGLPHAVVLALLDKYKMDATKVNFISIGDSGERWRSMLTGKFDATATTIDRIPEVEADPSMDVKILVNLPVELPEYLQSIMISSAKTIKEKDAGLTNFLVAYGQSMRYCIEHRDEAVAMSAQLASLEPAQAGFAYDWYKQNKKIDPNFVINPKAVEWMQSFNTRIGVQKAPLPMDKVLDPTIANKVIGHLGEYKF